MELRKERGLSQATVAKDLGVSLGIVCYWETNKSDPTASNIAKVARYFNVSADYLLGLSDCVQITTSYPLCERAAPFVIS